MDSAQHSHARAGADEQVGIGANSHQGQPDLDQPEGSRHDRDPYPDVQYPADQPGLGQPGFDQRSFDQPDFDQPELGQPGFDQPGLGEREFGRRDGDEADWDQPSQRPAAAHAPAHPPQAPTQAPSWGEPPTRGSDRAGLGRPGSAGEHEIQRRLSTEQRAERFYEDQMLDHLNERMREFVHRQEMFFLSTADSQGECDSTFRAGPPGFLHVVDEHTLVYPEYRGNGVHASLGNIQENPNLGILLMDFQHARIGLHINGRAELVEDQDLRAVCPELPVDPVPGRRPLLWVRVRVVEAYIHCAKHIPHLQKAPGRSSRDWGTDDYKRKGGDFFGTAREAKRRAAAEAESGAPATSDVPVTPDDVELLPAVEPDAVALDAVSPEPAASEPAAPEPGVTAPQPALRSTVPTQRPAPFSTPPAAPAPPSPGTPLAPVAASRASEPRSSEPRSRAPQALPVPVATLTSEPDPVVWRREAQRALDEAQRRGDAARDEGPYQGWFGG